jgi:MarR family transcriptional regulator for hemolysin
MALVELSRCEGLTQKELAERLGIEGPTLVRQLDDLERRGLIERRPASMDRRAKRVRVTQAARPVLTEITELASALRRELLGGLSDDSIVACVGVLRSINERLDAK